MIPNKLRVLALTLVLGLLGAVQAFAQGQTIYNNIPSPLPGNLPSVGYEATSAAEFGDRVQFSAGSGRSLLKVVQTMSSWGCQNGHWNTNDCVTTPGATFSHPITLNIYNVGAGTEPGTLIGSVTQTFAIPYRPSADPTHCTGGRWFDGTTCYNGYAVPITFNLSGLNVPNQVIYGIAYNTTHYGSAPIGEGAACFSSSAGCGYDSLNVATAEAPPTVGINPAPDDAYFNTLFAPFYCDGGLGGVGTFRLDASCWTGFKPAVRFNAANTPLTANDCKNGGWQTRTTATGQSFPNQGQCIQYVNTGK
jgi:hypothetical protein